MTTGATGTSLIAFLSQRLTRFLDDAFPPSTSAACAMGLCSWSAVLFVAE